MEEAVCETGKRLVLQIIKMAGYPHVGKSLLL